jgi:ATP-binding cassette subfamily C protein LapB
VMMIAWRVLAPLKSLFIALPKILQLKESCRQINQLLAISSENDKGLFRSALNYRFKGKIQFNQVNLRYPSAITSAVNSANFTIRPGEFVGILGRNGSGKSSLLKMIPGLYQPQAGCISIDNQDIRQLNPIQLRHSIAYLPQNPDLFYGTISQNLRLANPMASNDELIDATLRAGILSDINHLMDGFDTRMTEEFKQEVPSSFIQKLCLARVYLKNANIVLLDEPLNTLDAESVDYFKSALQEMRGKKTIVMICHRPSFLKTADRIIVMQDGRIQIQGPPEHVLTQFHKEMV